MDWREYEQAAFNELYYSYRPPHFIVIPDYREVVGMITRAKRQLDVAIFLTEDVSRPFIAVECKMYSRKLNVKNVESFIGMLGDLGAQEGILITPHGFSETASRRVEGMNIELVELPVDEAARLNWRELIRQAFPMDEAFHPEMGDAIGMFHASEEYEDLITAMERLPFEEWLTLFGIYRNMNSQRCKETLEFIALHHVDSGWIFNSIRLLDDFGWLSQDLLDALMQTDRIDPYGGYNVSEHDMDRYQQEEGSID
ncbi:MAG TPA: restriction endonuclease [bacterium]|nr:restriction endonuclease [bacterium]